LFWHSSFQKTRLYDFCPLPSFGNSLLVNKFLASENGKVFKATKKIVTKMNSDNFKGCSFCNNMEEGDRREPKQIK
jgi:hypothetical protein